MPDNVDEGDPLMRLWKVFRGGEIGFRCTVLTCVHFNSYFLTVISIQKLFATNVGSMPILFVIKRMAVCEGFINSDG